MSLSRFLASTSCQRRRRRCFQSRIFLSYSLFAWTGVVYCVQTIIRPVKTMSLKCPLTRPRYELHWTCRKECRRSVKDCSSRIISFVNSCVRPNADTISPIGNGSFILQLHVRMIHLAYFMFENRKFYFTYCCKNLGLC